MKPIILSLVPRGYLPWLRGGLELTARSVLEALIDLPAEGHLGAAMAPDLVNVSARLDHKLRGHYRKHYSVDRHEVHVDLYHPTNLAELVWRLRPAVLVCHLSGNNTLVEKVVDLDLPTLFYVHGSHIRGAFARRRGGRRHCFAAESTFIGNLVSAATGEPAHIIRPLLDPRRYRVSATGSAVLVVNPHPLKGGHRVIELARALPQRRFLVVGGWENTVRDDEVLEVEGMLARLPNVERIEHLDDMRVAFRRSHCLLMPCTVEEAYGRAAAEASIAGIPVLASDRGALPETVGDGGIVLPMDAPLDEWIRALDALFTDAAGYRRLVGAALSRAAEPDRQVDHIRRQLRGVIGELLAPEASPDAH